MSDHQLYNSLRLNYLYVDKYIFPSRWVFPHNRIPYSMLRLIKNGKAVFFIDEEEMTVKENQIIYIPQGSILQCRALEDDFTFISIRFTAAMPLDDMEIWSDGLGIQTITECTAAEVHEYFEKMVETNTTSLSGKYFKLRGYLELIMSYLVDVYAEKVESSKKTSEEENGFEHYITTDKPVHIKRRNMLLELKADARIQSVIEYLITHQEESPDIQLLCNLVNLSESSLRRLFKKHTGKTPGEFMQETRMVSAARQLLETDERISNIAYNLGFEDPNYFARLFKKNFGVSPRQYRKTSRE